MIRKKFAVASIVSKNCLTGQKSTVKENHWQRFILSVISLLRCRDIHNLGISFAHAIESRYLVFIFYRKLYLWYFKANKCFLSVLSIFPSEKKLIKQIVLHKMDRFNHHIVLIPAAMSTRNQSLITLFRNPLLCHHLTSVYQCIQPGLSHFRTIMGCSITGQPIGFQPFGYFLAEFCVAQCAPPW